MVCVPRLLMLCVAIVSSGRISQCFIQNGRNRDIVIYRREYKGTPMDMIPDPGLHEFKLFSEKRHKEAMLGRKFNKKGSSSQIRHYRIVGRGGGLPRLHKVSGTPTKRIKLPARRCMILGKMDNTKARNISHSGKKSHDPQRLNLQTKRIWCASKGYYVRLRISMRGLKTIKRLGLEEAARRFNLNLNNPKLFAGYANLKPSKPKQPVVPQDVDTESVISN